jgi:hypothetical protein
MKISQMRAIILLALVFVFFSCKKDNPDPLVYGQVIDRASGEPVPTAAVFMQRENIQGGGSSRETVLTIQTGTDGRFSFHRDSSFDLAGALAPGYLRIEEEDIYLKNSDKEIRIPIRPSGIAGIRISNDPKISVHSKVRVRPYFHEGMPSEIDHYGGEEETHYGQVKACNLNRVVVLYDWDLPGATADTLWYTVPWMGAREVLISY